MGKPSKSDRRAWACSIDKACSALAGVLAEMSDASADWEPRENSAGEDEKATFDAAVESLENTTADLDNIVSDLRDGAVP
jgi:hypothetical protein